MNKVIIDGLNEFNNRDPIAMDKLFETKVSVNDNVHRTNFTTDDEGKVNFISILNWIVAYNEPDKIIGVDIAPNGKIKKFYLDRA